MQLQIMVRDLVTFPRSLPSAEGGTLLVTTSNCSAHLRILQTSVLISSLPVKIFQSLLLTAFPTLFSPTSLSLLITLLISSNVPGPPSSNARTSCPTLGYTFAIPMAIGAVILATSCSMRTYASSVPIAVRTCPLSMQNPADFIK
nr:hypothetical protein B14D6.90 [imported] - Neurospora crassa [Neurospora crassa]